MKKLIEDIKDNLIIYGFIYNERIKCNQNKCPIWKYTNVLPADALLSSQLFSETIYKEGMPKCFCNSIRIKRSK